MKIENYLFNFEGDNLENIEIIDDKTKDNEDNIIEKQNDVKSDTEQTDTEQINLEDNETKLVEIINNINESKKKRGRPKGSKNKKKEDGEVIDAEAEEYDYYQQLYDEVFGDTKNEQSEFNKSYSDIFYLYASNLHETFFNVSSYFFNAVSKRYEIKFNISKERMHVLNILLADILRRKKIALPSEIIYVLSMFGIIATSIRKKQ